MTRCLKVLREAACLQLAERLFQSFTPLNEKHFLPFSVNLRIRIFFKGQANFR